MPYIALSIECIYNLFFCLYYFNSKECLSFIIVNINSRNESNFIGLKKNLGIVQSTQY